MSFGERTRLARAGDGAFVIAELYFACARFAQRVIQR